jgi:hypothetical protein
MRLCAGWRLNNLAYLILLACNLPPKGTLAVAADFAAEIGSRFESNASNSDKPSDRLADGFLTARVDAGTNGVWGRDWRWRASLSGEGEEAFRFNGLSQIEGGVRLGVDRKFGLGWKAPRLQFDLYSAFRGAGQPGASGFRLVPSFALVWQIRSSGSFRPMVRLEPATRRARPLAALYRHRNKHRRRGCGQCRVGIKPQLHGDRHRSESGLTARETYQGERVSGPHHLQRCNPICS